MTLESLDAKIASLRDESAKLIRSYRDTVAKVNADTTLTPEGKALQLNGLKESTQAKVAALQQQEKSAAAAEALSLERRIGGTASGSDDILRYRDAQDRALALQTPEEACTALRSAIARDDRELAKAYVSRAMTERDGDPLARAFDGSDTGQWASVVQQYVDAYPDTAGPVSDLFQLRRRENSTAYQFGSSASYVVL